MSESCQCVGLDGPCPVFGSKIREAQREKCRTREGYFHFYRRQLGSVRVFKGQQPVGPPPAPITHTPESLPCPYRGEELEWLPCLPCRSSGRVSALTYECELHDQCTLHHNTFRSEKHNLTVVACVSCQDRPGFTAQSAPKPAR